MNRLAVINVVGLTESLIGEHTPRIAEFRQRGALAQIAPAFPGRHLHRAVELSHRQNAVAARHRRQRLVQPRTRRSPILETIKPPRAKPENLGRTPKTISKSSIVNRHSRQLLLVVQHVFHRRIIPSRRARCIPPMAGRFSIFIPGRIPSARKSNATSANFRSSVFGGRRRESKRRKAPPMPPRAGLPNPQNGLKTNIRRR